jgi:DNA-binding MarR family transcriptional regulator
MTTIFDLTTNERGVMAALLSELNDQDYGFSTVSVTDIAKKYGFDTKEIRGTVASLVKKELIYILESDKGYYAKKSQRGIEQIVYLTDAGYKMLGLGDLIPTY